MAIVRDMRERLSEAVEKTLNGLASPIEDMTVSYHLHADKVLEHCDGEGDEDEDGGEEDHYPHFIETRVWRLDLHLMEGTEEKGRSLTTTGTTPYGCSINGDPRAVESLAANLWEYALCLLMLSVGEVEQSMQEIVREAEQEH